MSVPENRILGSYRLLERIGKGGMGEVYRGEHLKLGREAAVKVLPSNLVNEADFLKRFEREASSAAKLEHPNILPVYEYGEQPTPYLVMPYVKGGTLKEKMSAGKLSQAEIISYLRQMAEALDYAHEQGIIHRDVKPANMLIDDRGRLYLSDFGIAKALEGAEGLTRTGVGVGTPEYMAPEQAQGRADSRSDLYALGIILYQMLTGRVPYSGNSTVEVLMKHLQDPLPMLPLRSANPPLPPRVEQIIQKSLAKNPNERYGSGRAMVEDFTEAMSAGPGAGAGDATVVSGPGALGGAATVVSNTPPPFGGQQTMPAGNTPLPQYGSNTPPPQYGGNTPLPPGVTPPMGMNQPGYNQPTVVGGQQGGFGSPQGGGFGGQQGGFGAGSPPPMGGGMQPLGGMQPPMGGMQQGGGMQPPYPPAGGRTQQGSSGGSRRGLLIGGGIAAAVVLVLCIGIGAFAASRGGKDPTPTVNANATASVVAAANLTATQTAGAAKPSASASASASAAASSAPPSVAASLPPASAPPSAPPSAPASASALPSPSAAPSPSPRASASASAPASAPPTVRPSASASARASAVPKPLGTAPAGWKTYNGNAKAPFVMYYPPDWTVDESGAKDGRIYFYGPGVKEPVSNQLWVLIATTGIRDPQGNIDVLRDKYFKDQFGDYPDAKVDVTRQNVFSVDIKFASLGVTFDGDSYAYIGLGLRDQVPWRFRLNSLYDDYDQNLEDYFQGMISSMYIYANP